jgi:LysM repeat protein
MTVVEPGRTTSAPPGATDAGDGRPLIGQCPYLAAQGGAWRSATPAREHRCGAVTPPAPLAVEKQRRLCLTPDHLTCATYEAARAARWIAPDRPATLPRPVARTTPVVLDRGRVNLAIPALRADRSTGQVVLVGVLVIAFVAIVLAKLSSGGPTVVGGAVASSSPRASVAGAGHGPGSASSAPTGQGGSPGPSASGAGSPPPSGAPTPRPTTYTVHAHDTLAGIAKRFGTTAAILAKLNKIKDPTKLTVGQVLKLP